MKTKLALMISGAFFSLPVLAQSETFPESSAHSDLHFADVVTVEPIVEEVDVAVNERVCWDEEVYHHHRLRSETPSIVGSIIGGVVGNQFGGGRGRHIATAAGALLGGSIARDIQHKKGRGGAQVTTERRCEIERHWETEEQIVGYEVSYEYEGEIYHTRMDEPPGDKIPVRISVTPVAGY